MRAARVEGRVEGGEGSWMRDSSCWLQCCHNSWEMAECGKEEEGEEGEEGVRKVVSDSTKPSTRNMRRSSPEVKRSERWQPVGDRAVSVPEM